MKNDNKKLTDIFKEKAQRILRMDPPLSMFSAIKEHNLILDVETIKPEEIKFLEIILSLPFIKIVLKPGPPKKNSDAEKPFYTNRKFQEVIRLISKNLCVSEVIKSLSM